MMRAAQFESREGAQVVVSHENIIECVAGCISDAGK